MRSIESRLQEVYDKLASNKLYKNQSLGNGLRYYIFDYDPEDEYIVNDYFDTYLSLKEEFHLKLIDIYK